MELMEIIYLMAGIIVGLLVGSNNPRRVKLAADKIELLTKEVVDKAVDKSVEELKKIR